MFDKEQFEQALVELLRVARTNENHLDQKDITDYFSEYELDSEKTELLLNYFESNGVIVLGHEAVEAEAEISSIQTEEEVENEEILAMYEEDLREISPLSAKEQESLLRAVREGNETAKNQLIEAHLYSVVEMAKAYQNQGVLLADLIQEGNIGLIRAIASYKESNTGDFESYMRKEIEDAMRSAIGEQKETAKTAEKLAKHANRLSEVAKLLAEKLEREATLEELAEGMHMTVEEIKEIMKLSLDAISVNQ